MEKKDPRPHCPPRPPKCEKCGLYTAFMGMHTRTCQCPKEIKKEVMSRIDELSIEIKALENKLEPLQKERRDLWSKQAEDIEQKIKLTSILEDKFEIDDLVFAARHRCKCGAGLAYPKGIGMHGLWYCSDILLGRALPANDPDSKQHDAGFPFSFYSIKSDNQPSAEGHSTRPKG